MSDGDPESSFSLDDDAEVQPGTSSLKSQAHVRIGRRNKRRKMTIDLPDQVDTGKMEELLKNQLQ